MDLRFKPDERLRVDHQMYTRTPLNDHIIDIDQSIYIILAHSKCMIKKKTCYCIGIIFFVLICIAACMLVWILYPYY